MNNRPWPAAIAILFLLLTAPDLEAQNGETEISLPIVVDGRQISEISTRITPDEELLLDPFELYRLIESRLEPGYEARLNPFEAGQFVSIEALEPLELDIIFDLDELAVLVSIPPELRRAELISFRSRPRELRGVDVHPARFSAILNLGTNVRYSYAPDTLLASATVEPAVNVYGVAVESRASLQTGPDPFTFDYARTTYDFPELGYRLQAGDLPWRETNLSDVSGIAGLSIARLAMFRERSPGDRILVDNIFLPRDGELLIYLNDRLIRRSVVSAGTYRLNGLGLSSGINTIRVVWDGEDGRQEVELVVPADSRLLGPGEFEAGIALGIADRDVERPVIAAYERIGIGPFFTLGLRQGIEALEFQLDLGFEAITATRFGAFAIDADIGIGPDERLLISLPLRYTYHDPALPRFRNIDLTAGWQRLVNEAGEPAREQVNAGASVSLTLGTGMSLTPRVNYRYDLLDSRQRVDARASLRTSAGGGTSVRVDTGIVYDEEISFVASVTVSSAFPEQRQNLFLQQNLVTQEFAGFWTRYADETVDPYSFNAAVQIPVDTERVASISAGAGYRNPFLQASLGHSVNFVPAGGDMRNTSSVGLQTAAVFADGAFAMTRPVGDSFVIISTADHVSENTFRVRRGGGPDRDLYIQDESVFFGGVRSHVPQQINLEMEEFDPSIDVDELSYVIRPTYRSGIHLVIDPVRRVQARGVLLDAGGNPVTLTVGSASARVESPADDAAPTTTSETSPLVFFTDETGYFELYDLLPGSYELRVGTEPDLRWVLDVESDGEQAHDAGELRPEGQTP
ncbi:MAG: hypothetical protein EA383_13315 [Spirochaetaceae bacterium]|nr:MAG: hypothetical protein EA383_13315 [Spirochaetaceae bacterium]